MQSSFLKAIFKEHHSKLVNKSCFHMIKTLKNTSSGSFLIKLQPQEQSLQQQIY